LAVSVLREPLVHVHTNSLRTVGSFQTTMDEDTPWLPSSLTPRSRLIELPRGLEARWFQAVVVVVLVEEGLWTRVRTSRKSYSCGVMFAWKSAREFRRLWYVPGRLFVFERHQACAYRHAFEAYERVGQWCVDPCRSQRSWSAGPASYGSYVWDR
jgi:hypothetical protein